MSEHSESMFIWTQYYSNFADKLLLFENNRSELLKIIKNTFDSLNMKYPFMDNGLPLDDICPFTVYGVFNKGITTENRITLMKSIGKQIGVHAEVPSEFDGVPVLNNMKAAKARISFY